MARAPDSVRLAMEAKTFTTNAGRTPETTQLIVRALIEYGYMLRNWLADNSIPNAMLALVDPSSIEYWQERYNELRAVEMALKALGVEQ